MSKKANLKVAGFFKALFDFVGSTIKTLVLAAVVGCLSILLIITGFVSFIAYLVR